MTAAPFHDIAGPEDFLEKLREEQRDVQANPLSTRHAINAALTAWHMCDWVWAFRIKPDRIYRNQLKLGKARKDAFVALVARECPPLTTMRDVANGAKHLAPGVVVDEGLGPFGPAFSDAFDKGPRLAVRKSDGSKIPFRSELGRSVRFWEGFLERYPGR